VSSCLALRKVRMVRESFVSHGNVVASHTARNAVADRLAPLPRAPLDTMRLAGSGLDVRHRHVAGVAVGSRNTRFQAARYGLTWSGLAPADRASLTGAFRRMG
jgi:hypothetical protein